MGKSRRVTTCSALPAALGKMKEVLELIREEGTADWEDLFSWFVKHTELYAVSVSYLLIDLFF